MGKVIDEDVIANVSEAFELLVDADVSEFLVALRSERVPHDMIIARRDELTVIASDLVQRLRTQLRDVLDSMRAEVHRPPHLAPWPAPIGFPARSRNSNE